MEAELVELPDDCWVQILLQAPVADILRFAATSKRFHEMLNEDYVWVSLLERDFGHSIVKCCLGDELNLSNPKTVYRNQAGRFHFNTSVACPSGVSFVDDATCAKCDNGSWNTVFGEHVWLEGSGVHTVSFAMDKISTQVGLLSLAPSSAFTCELSGTKLVSLGSAFKVKESIHHHGKFQYTSLPVVPGGLESVFLLGDNHSIYASPSNYPRGVVARTGLQYRDYQYYCSLRLDTNTREFEFWTGRPDVGSLQFQCVLEFPGPWVPVGSMTGECRLHANLLHVADSDRFLQQLIRYEQEVKQSSQPKH